MHKHAKWNRFSRSVWPMLTGSGRAARFGGRNSGIGVINTIAYMHLCSGM